MRVPIVIAAAAVVALSACAGSEPDDAVPADSAPASSVDEPEPEPSSSTSDPAPAPSDPPATDPPAADPPATDPPAERDFAEVDAIVADFVDGRGLNGAGLIVVDADDGVVHEQYWGEFGPERISLVASSSKQITAGVLLHLADQGLLDMDAPVAAAVEWGSGNPDVTPAQLVSSRSGLVGLLDDPLFGPYLCQFVALGDIEQCAESIFTTSADDGDIVPPDTAFRYGGAQWQVAGGLAEAVSGRTWDELIDEIYVEPCGLETLAYNNHFGQFGAGFSYPEQFDGGPSELVPTDNPNMEGGAYLNVPDYGKLLQMHLDGGRCGDVQVLSPEALEQMYTDHLAPLGIAAYPGAGYGMGWFVDRATGRLTDPGAYGSVPWLDLDDGYGAYLVIERDSNTGNELAAMLYEPVERAVLGG